MAWPLLLRFTVMVSSKRSAGCFGINHSKKVDHIFLESHDPRYPETQFGNTEVI